MFELLLDQVGGGGAGEVDKDHFEVRQGLQGAHESHGLARARGATQNERAMFTQPGTQDVLVSQGVYSGNDQVSISHFLGVDVYSWYFVLPQVPLSIIYFTFIVNQTVLSQVLRQAQSFNIAIVNHYFYLFRVVGPFKQLE